MLYSINQGILVIWMDVTGMYGDVFHFSSCQARWYKNTMRREEIAMLMQGLTLPNPRPCTTPSLPPAMEWPFSPPPSPVEPFKFFEPLDTCGQAHVRRRASGNMSSTPPPLSTSLSPTTNMSSTPPPVSTIISVMPAPSITPVLATTTLPAPTTIVPSVATTSTSSTPDLATVTIHEPAAAAAATAAAATAAEVTVSTVPRTTDWRHRKGLAKTPQKHYVCGVCGRHKSS